MACAPIATATRRLPLLLLLLLAEDERVGRANALPCAEEPFMRVDRWPRTKAERTVNVQVYMRPRARARV